jgi:hypothetical protein
MYTGHKKYGIGKVVAEKENSYTIYYEEKEKTIEVPKIFAKIYATESEAEDALNPQMTDDEKRSLYEKIKKEEAEWNEVRGASARMSEMNHENNLKIYRAR